MTKVKIQYISLHQPRSIIEVEEQEAIKLVMTKKYKYIEDDRNKPNKRSRNVKPVKEASRKEADADKPSSA